jgi:hypothetical protein
MEIHTMSIYTEEGYQSRLCYLRSLAEEHDVDVQLVYAAAAILGPNEDFDGLVTAIEDESLNCRHDDTECLGTIG